MPRTPLGSTHYLLAALPSRVTRETCTMAVRRRVLLALLIALGAALSLARVIATAPLLIALGATLPPVAVAAVLIFPGRRDPARFTAHLAAFMWGALGAAFMASAMNDALSVWVDAVAGEESARAFVPALGGPIVEEVTKAAGLVAILLLAPGALAGLVDGIVCGALVGLGFTMTENIRYLTLAALQGGSAGLDRALWVRVALGGFTHAVFTATAGAGLGWTRERLPARSLWVPAAVLAAAILQHVLWNTVTSRTIAQMLCNPTRPGGPCGDAPEPAALIVTIPLVTAAGLAPGVLGLVAAAVWAHRRRRSMVDGLSPRSIRATRGPAKERHATMSHVIWSILTGFVVGLLARALLPGADHMGLLATSALGIAGSFVGGLIGRLINPPQAGTTFHAAGFFLSIVGAIVLLYAFRLMQ
ncbi:MAG: PrsW family intramembrane metalloprotease [Deltaproteobacteria bacterium]|nr:MAG: PrsW family intramembrane metalloprotease [Deltaproteobacteria bacterium]